MISPAITYTRIKMSLAGKALLGLGLGGLGLAGVGYAATRKKAPSLVSTDINAADRMADAGAEGTNRRFTYRTDASGNQVRVPVPASSQD
jgi:hypothetical protein